MLRMLDGGNASSFSAKTTPSKSGTVWYLLSGSESTTQTRRITRTMMRQISHEMLDGSLNSKAPNITRGMGIAIRSNRSQYVPLIRLDSMELMDVGCA
jgi:hypothetical protein